jgi:outer membrane receptor for ferrienterochelin and colicin
VEVDMTAVTGPLRHTGSYTFQRALGTSANEEGFVPLRLTPRHTANYQLVWNAPAQLELTNTVEYVSEQFQLDNYGGTKLPPYAVWNARLERPFGLARVYVGVDNIADRLYGESITFGNPVPQPTRSYYGGVKLRF